MEHCHISSGESPKWHSSVFLWSAFKLWSKKRPSTTHHLVIQYKGLELLWLLLLFLHSASTYSLSSPLPFISSPQPHFIKESHSSPSSADKWNSKSLHQRKRNENVTGLFLISPPAFQVLNILHSHYPISHLNSPMYTSSSLMEKLSTGFGKIWSRSYINK